MKASIDLSALEDACEWVSGGAFEPSVKGRG
jgi:hypothetical protein